MDQVRRMGDRDNRIALHSRSPSGLTSTFYFPRSELGTNSDSGRLETLSANALGVAQLCPRL